MTVTVWLFHGEMGSGKTTLIKMVCKVLGVEEAMSSPTFSIVNEYETVDKEEVYHFDFYRIKDEVEAYRHWNGRIFLFRISLFYRVA